ncbi:protease [Pedobacter psychrodurus]|uniref:Protease n=1 Tax=Pedobacter psychrodurus TaxID=2530456 RepID=A0A4R0PXZ4_9SPHI|nr:M57 family metalloprotease [Pedobacter psychrodurus]TCD24770.1 protease [Pedobacter psychrodurus]
MKHLKFSSTITACLFITAFYACKNNATEQTAETKIDVPADKIEQIKSLGFGTSNVEKYEDGYVVEGDIFLTEENLTETASGISLNIAETEQYRTKNLVKSLPRVISISVGSNLADPYSKAADIMISRYNALDLRIKFKRAMSGKTGDIHIGGFREGPKPNGTILLGYAGFPKASGEPHPNIKMNIHPQAYGTNPNKNYIASVLQHEIGHCIGFRHTDYMNRNFSCPNDPGNNNEGKDDIGAIRIKGTPSKPDAGSIMLACFDGSSSTFNDNDIVALKHLYK